jgi:hypothetical protein
LLVVAPAAPPVALDPPRPVSVELGEPDDEQAPLLSANDKKRTEYAGRKMLMGVSFSSVA